MLICWACAVKRKLLAPKRLRLLIQAGSNSPHACLPALFLLIPQHQEVNSVVKLSV